MKITEKAILAALWKKFDHKYQFINTYIGPNELDWISFTHSKICWEIEVKTSLSDYKNDFKKEAKHVALSKKAWHTNRFYYAVPEGMIDEVPEYAGLIYVSFKSFDSVKIVKKAPILSKDKLDPKRFFDKMYYYYHKQTTNKLLKIRQ